MSSVRGKVVVVTGASSGIGAALAQLVEHSGGHAVLVARREEELRRVAATAGPGALAVVADCAVRGDVERVLAEAVARHGGVDVWVNNAGRGITHSPSQTTRDDLVAMLDANVTTALYGSQVALEHFCQRGSGHLVNVSSELGRRGDPTRIQLPFVVERTAYSASKHMLNALTVGLRMEAAQRCPAVRVSTVSPGVVATEFGVNALHGGLDSRAIPGAQTAEEVAAVVLDVIEHPRAEAYTRPETAQRVEEYYAEATDMAQFENASSPFPTVSP
eukprot:m51a1_g11090 putative 3-oxoacyl-[acyl-carrier protein] reductase (274) ;mRNA; f:18630-19837